jgi:hypothetical protein
LCRISIWAAFLRPRPYNPVNFRQVRITKFLVVDDEPDVELLFRQHFRRDLREGRFTMEFAQSGDMALQRIADAAGCPLF